MSCLTAGGLTVAGDARAADGSVPGTAESQHPTLHNLSISWPLDGDDDADGVVSVRWRKEGDATFRDGLPLFRVPGGANEEGYSWENRHAGSIFGLDEGTTYEVELTLTDPDGGSTTQTISTTTRTMPQPGASEVGVDPGTIADAIAAAQPGTVLVLADGTYGEIIATADGAAGAPITLRPANEGGAVLEGDLRLDGRQHWIVEGLVIHGKAKFNDSSNITLRGNHVETDEDGFVAYGSGVIDGIFVDNTILGATAWAESSLGVDGDNVGEGIVITGPGNVIAFNRVSGFRDCLSLLEDDLAVDQYAIDIYGNDLDVCADDGIEADFSMGNVRVYENRIDKSFMGISSQPSLGGPAYFIRNAMFNIAFQAFKLQRNSVGDVALHNTAVKSGDALSVFTEATISRAFFRNNLFVGGPGADHNGYHSGPGDVIDVGTADASCSFDYDAFGSTHGAFEGDLGGTAFASLAELRASTTEAHAIQIDLGAFAAAVAYPADPFAPPATPSLELAEGAAPVDAGIVLANVNDGFVGDAPDMGAYELGLEPPLYGPGGHLGGTGSGSGSGGGSGTAGGSSDGDGDGDGPGSGGAGTAASGTPDNGSAASGSGSNVGGVGGVGGGDGAADGGGDGCGCEAVGAPARGGIGGVMGALVLAVASGRRRGSKQA